MSGTCGKGNGMRKANGIGGRSLEGTRTLEKDGTRVFGEMGH